MLNPDVTATNQMLLSSFDDMLSIQSYAAGCNSLMIGKAGDEDPDWLEAVRSRTGMLRDSMSSFMQVNPEIFSGIWSPFINYQSLFSAFASKSKSIQGKDQWIEFLGVLRDTLSSAVISTNNANVMFQRHYQAVANIQPLLNDSIAKGWSELASEEQEMVDIATVLGSLYQAVQDLGSELIASDIQNGKAYIQSSVAIAYALVTTGGASIPFLTVAAVVFTVGSSVYELIFTDATIKKDLGEIEALQNKASAAAQAAAATKAVIQVLSNMGRSFLSMATTLPGLAQMWGAEHDKIVNAIDAINSGSDPKLYFDIQTMEIANQAWLVFLDLVTKLQQSPVMGKPVTINNIK